MLAFHDRARHGRPCCRRRQRPAQFDDILAAAEPELAGHVQAVMYHADTGRLDAIPDAPAYGTRRRWIASKPIQAVNTQVPDAKVRILHVLSPAPGKADRSSPTAASRRPAIAARARRTGGWLRRPG
ncbi:hypothetical protein GCM10010236_07810 [Streptomyces eurythermus]|nr:hypothetical protein GCM10010236_07810 [Streptomyces eurythermus]